MYCIGIYLACITYFKVSSALNGPQDHDTFDKYLVKEWKICIKIDVSLCSIIKLQVINYAHFLIQLAVNVSNIQMRTMLTNSETNDSKCTSQYISEKYWIKTRNKTSIKYT